MMRIAYVINSMEGGGAQTPLPKIVAALAKAGARVRVLALTRRNGHAIERLQAAGIDPLVREGGESDQIAAYRWICEQAREWGCDLDLADAGDAAGPDRGQTAGDSGGELAA